jgi:hypothetical protein
MVQQARFEPGWFCPDILPEDWAAGFPGKSVSSCVSYSKWGKISFPLDISLLDTPGTLLERSWNAPGTLWERSWNALGTFGEHSGNTIGIFLEHSGPSREPSERAVGSGTGVYRVELIAMI